MALRTVLRLHPELALGHLERIEGVPRHGLPPVAVLEMGAHARACVLRRRAPGPRARVERRPGPEWRWQLPEGGTFAFTPKIYAYLDKEENPDIDDYRGYVDWRFRFDSGANWIATTVFRYGTANKGSVLIDLSRRTRDLKFGPISTYLHVQFFAGYGEDILDYNVKNKSQLRFGFAIVP